MSFAEKHTAMLRLMLLEILEKAPGYTAHERLLPEQMEDQGMVMSIDQVRTELTWLSEQGLVEYSGTAVILTDRGMDVAKGRLSTPGVQRRPPGGVIGVGCALLAQRLKGGS
jgi:repressor of nif and glnA expression